MPKYNAHLRNVPIAALDPIVCNQEPEPRASDGLKGLMHVAEVVSLEFVLNCLHLRLIVWTQSLKIIILVRIVQFLSRRTVIECVSSLAYKRDVLITSAIVKAILASVDCICNVRTLLVDLDPPSQS